VSLFLNRRRKFRAGELWSSGLLPLHCSKNGAPLARARDPHLLLGLQVQPLDRDQRGPMA
jgi:hypothetical protein